MANLNILYINSVDFTDLANRYGFAMGYTPVNGPNGGIMEDGTEVIDRRGQMATIAWPMNDLPAADLSRLLDICLRDPYVSVLFRDTWGNKRRTGVFTAQVGQQQFLLTDNDGSRWFCGPMLTLREVQHTV